MEGYTKTVLLTSWLFMYTCVPCEGKIKKKNSSAWVSRIMSYVVWLRLTLRMLSVSLHQCPICVSNRFIMNCLWAWMTNIIFISWNLRAWKRNVRRHQNCLPSCEQTWLSFQKAVDKGQSGPFSEAMDIPPLNKSCLLFNNLYSWDVPSHKELAFRLDQSFSILLEE